MKLKVDHIACCLNDPFHSGLVYGKIPSLSVITCCIDCGTTDACAVLQSSREDICSVIKRRHLVPL